MTTENLSAVDASVARQEAEAHMSATNSSKPIAKGRRRVLAARSRSAGSVESGAETRAGSRGKVAEAISVSAFEIDDSSERTLERPHQL
jgi:hypothetical protein